MAKSKVHTIARKLAGVFFILLFAFSITPVALLHDAVTSHKDVCYHNFEEKGKAITKADVNCHCLSFVADEPFVASLFPFQSRQLILVNSPCNFIYPFQFYSQFHLFTELRGPPVLTRAI